MADNDTPEMGTTGSDTEIVEDNDTATEGDADAIRAELENTRKALKRANREAADRRKTLEQYEQQEQERRDAELSELDKAKAALEKARTAQADAEARLARKLQHDAFFGATSEAGFTWASEQARRDAVKLIEWADVDGDDMAELVKQLKKDREYLFQQPRLPDVDGKKRGNASPADADEDKVRDAARRYGVPYSSKE